VIIRIEKASGVPVTRQIFGQIRAQCATGALQPGDQLPSVRQLAHDLAVNQNTVLKVYERLEAEGLLERRHGSGTYVAAAALRKPLRQEHDRLRVEAETLVRHAVALDLGPGDIRGLLSQAFGKIESESKEGREK